MNRGAGCMGKPLVRFCEGQEFNCDMDKILWHRRESRRKQRKQILPCSHGSLLSTRKRHLSTRAGVLALCNPQRSPATPAVSRSLRPCPGPKSTVSGRTLIWLTVVKSKIGSCPTVFQRSLFWLYSKAPKEAEPVLRRLITLIFAGWIPHDLASSRSCLGLVSGVRPKRLIQ